MNLSKQKRSTCSHASHSKMKQHHKTRPKLSRSTLSRSNHTALDNTPQHSFPRSSFNLNNTIHVTNITRPGGSLHSSSSPARRSQSPHKRSAPLPPNTTTRTFFHSSHRLYYPIAAGQDQLQKQLCWKCPPETAPLSGLALFCDQCKTIQPPAIPLANQNYFDLYQLPTQYTLDKTALERNFRSLQQSLHPDLFSSKSDEEQEIAADYSAYLNRSVEILSDDMLRAKYLLFLQSPVAIMYDESKPNYEHLPSLYNHPLTRDDCTGIVPLEQEEREKNGAEHTAVVQHKIKSRLSIDDLEDIFEKRETAEWCEDNDVLLKVFRANGDVLSQFKQDLVAHLDQHRDVEKALFTLELFHYYRNLQFELLERIPADVLTDEDRKRF